MTLALDARRAALVTEAAATECADRHDAIMEELARLTYGDDKPATDAHAIACALDDMAIARRVLASKPFRTQAMAARAEFHRARDLVRDLINAPHLFN